MALAHPRLRAKRDALRAALPGHVRPHHRVLLRQHLRVVDTLQATIGELDAAIGAALAPCHAAVAHLVTIPGVSRLLRKPFATRASGLCRYQYCSTDGRAARTASQCGGLSFFSTYS